MIFNFRDFCNRIKSIEGGKVWVKWWIKNEDFVRSLNFYLVVMVDFWFWDVDKRVNKM